MSWRGLRLLALVLLTGPLLGGCSSLVGGGDTISSEAASPVSPLKLDISQAFIDRDILHVKVIVEAQTDVPAKEVALVLKGYREGALVSQQVKELGAEFGKAEIARGQRAAVHLSLPASGLSEYQVQCSWGKDASELIAAQPAAPLKEEAPAVAAEDRSEKTLDAPEPVKVGGGTLIIRNIEDAVTPLQCETPPCDALHVLTAELANLSASAAGNIQLALGVYWVQAGKEQRYPEAGAALAENEQIVSLDRLELPPGGKKKIRITVDKALPNLPGGAFAPHLRILRFDAR